MKTFDYLPETIEIVETHKTTIGNHYKAVNLYLVVGKENKEIIKEAKRNRKHYRTVKVLSKNLRGKLDLHNKPYKPHTYIFVEK